MTTVITNSAQETEQLGERLAKQLTGAETIALFGGLGMGKTAFTRGLCRGLGTGEVVSSPTFAVSGLPFRHVPRHHLGRSVFHRLL